MEALSEPARGGQVAVVVVVVVGEDGRDGRQVLEDPGRLPDSPRSDQIRRTRAVEIFHRMRPDVPDHHLNQEYRNRADEHDGRTAPSSPGGFRGSKSTYADHGVRSTPAASRRNHWDELTDGAIRVDDRGPSK